MTTAPTDPDPRTRYSHTGLPHHNGAVTPTLAAIAAYRAWSHDSMFVPPPTPAQVRLLAEYCQDFVNQYTYPVDAIADLRRRVVQIKTLTDLADWLWDCRQSARLEPL